MDNYLEINFTMCHPDVDLDIVEIDGFEDKLFQIVDKKSYSNYDRR